ncbi:MAG: hypothetical protein KKB30_02935 [Proteobacteria bacterium]|nr:hypothetical protein [Pseudomonadota bacterium]MBU1716056.1 hypothetical protein [Pseudomonadota bacterium]
MSQIKCRLVMFSMFCLLVSCGGGGSSSPPATTDPTPDSGGSTKDWTYMIYLGADNTLSTSGLVDLNEMETVGSTDQVNVVLQAEFSTKYTTFSEFGHPSYVGDTLRMLVQKDNDPNDVDLEAGTSIGNVDMGSPAALKGFIQWAAATYPADHYALVVWDHGAGWKTAELQRGAVEDATSGSFMSLPDLAKAVSDSGVHFDLINFDACLMGMYEVAYEFRGLTDYMVFSEEVEPGDGDPYDTILAALVADPSMTGNTLARTIVDKYIDFYGSGSRSEKVTKSAIAMSGLDALHTSVINLASTLVADYSTNSGLVLSALTNSQSYAYPSNYDLYDFSKELVGQFPSGAIRTAAQAVMAQIDDPSFVVRNNSLGSAVAGSKGLAIYLPQSNQISVDQVVDELQKYSQLACNQNRATAWYDAVVAVMEGRIEDLVKGDFTFYIEWTGDADLDLYVWEPDAIYAPWMGQTTPNGFLSGDSAETGSSEEYYSANSYVQSGQYDFLVNYYENGHTSSSAEVYLWYRDATIDDQWYSYGPVTLNLSQQYTGDFTDLSTLSDLNAYSDWWYRLFTTRMSDLLQPPVLINTGSRVLNINFRSKKRKPDFNNLIKER